MPDTLANPGFACAHAEVRYLRHKNNYPARSRVHTRYTCHIAAKSVGLALVDVHSSYYSHRPSVGNGGFAGMT